jgi:hypothetical protein
MEQARDRSKLGDKDKWNSRELVSFGEDLAGDEMERALLLSRRELGEGGGPATSTHRGCCIV